MEDLKKDLASLRILVNEQEKKNRAVNLSAFGADR
jgi:hypothetical protein